MRKKLIKPKGARKEFYERFASFMRCHGRRPSYDEIRNKLYFEPSWVMNNLGRLKTIERRIKKGVVEV